MATTSSKARSRPKAGKKPRTRPSPHRDGYWIRTKPPSKRTRGFYVIRWIETHCVHTQGRWVGKPFRLLPWQKLFILALFAVDAKGRRIARWALLGVPKKNGKTELAAALALYFLVGDGEPAPLIAVAAGSDEQADLVFGAAKYMAEHSPTLSKILEAFEKEIQFRPGAGGKRPAGKIRRLSAATGTNDGPSYSAVICDELHEWVGKKGEQLWNILTNSGGAREQPVILQITTAGFDRETICYRQYAYGMGVAGGKIDGRLVPKIDDERYVFHWIQPPPDVDHRDPKVWEAVNPSYGVTVQREFFEDQLKKKPEGIFRRYFLNAWTRAYSRWVRAEAWNACKSRPRIDDDAPIFVGVQGAAKRDQTAVYLVRKDDAGNLHTVGRTFEPAAEGAIIDPVDVEDHLRALDQSYEVERILYNPQLFHRSALVLLEEGLPMVALAQSAQAKQKYSQALFDAIMQKRLRHGGDPVLSAQVEMTEAKDRGSAWTIVEENNRVPAVVAVAMAVDAADADEGTDSGFATLDLSESLDDEDQGDGDMPPE